MSPLVVALCHVLCVTFFVDEIATSRDVITYKRAGVLMFKVTTFNLGRIVKRTAIRHGYNRMDRLKAYM